MDLLTNFDIVTRYNYKGLSVLQKDGSDTQLFLSFLERNPINKVPLATEEDDCLFDNSVAIRYHYWEEKLKPKFNKAPKNHPNIKRAITLLKNSWPEAYDQFKHIVREFTPVFLPNTSKEGQVGSMSHQPEKTYGSIWATVNDHICLTQAFVHEMAHNKLFALGQGFESSAPLFKNKIEELYDSPIRLDIPRPISAVFHALYAFTHVIALNNRMLSSNLLSDKDEIYVKKLLYKNVKRVQIALDVIKKCALPTNEGEPFLEEVISWTSKEISKAKKHIGRPLKNRSYLIIGPEGSGKSIFSKNFSNQTGKTIICLDTICWDLWYKTSVIQEIITNSYGESRVCLFNKILSNEQKKKLIIRLINENIITIQVFDQLKMNLLLYCIKKFRNNHIIDCSSNHCLFFEILGLQYLKEQLIKNDIEIIQVRPIASISKTLEILKGRTRENSLFYEKKYHSIHQSLLSPCYRTLSDFIVDSSKDIAKYKIEFL